MARTNVPLVALGNRGLISPKALARIDLDRTAMSAEVFENWIGKTTGALTIRPGTKWMGSSLRDTGAEFIEFVASTDDVALPEITHQKMRVWMGSDAHNLALLGRPAVNTTVTLSDTGWVNASTGGNFGATVIDLIPTMTAATTNGVTLSASSDNGLAPDFGGRAWNAADDSNDSFWADTGDDSASTLPSWLNVNFGSGNTKAVGSYSLRASPEVNRLDNMVSAWELLGSNSDTGTYATDTGKWILEDSRSAQTGWAISEKRSYTLSDTGTPGPWRHWRLYVTALDGDTELNLAELEMFGTSSPQAAFNSGTLTLNATSIGALAKATKRVVVSDTGTEHSLAINVARGPVTLRVGSTAGDDDYINETSLGTGHHNLAFTPAGNFHITVQSDVLVNRIVNSLAIGDSGTVEIPAPWAAANLDDIRYDQSADVVYVDCEGVRPSKIERRGTGRSWSVVDYAPNDGPFLSAPSSSAKLSVSHFYGNTTLNSNIPFFTSDHVGALVRVFHEGQGGQWRLGALDAKTDAIQVTGISDTGDTGTPSQGSERRITISVTGTYVGTLQLERSIDGSESGFHPVSTSGGYIKSGTTATDTGTFSRVINDRDDNVKAWYRVKMTAYTSGVAVVAMTYEHGGVTGIGRVTGYNSNTNTDIEVLSRFSDTGTSDNWQQGYWSTARGFPTAVALHGGRLGHAQGGSIFLSESDNYESFDETIEGDAAPIIRTLGSGPVDNIHYLVSLLRLIIGTAGAELAVRSSSLDEPLTGDNSGVLPFSTQGSANLRALRMDTRAIMVQRSKQRVFMVGPAENTLADYEGFELTLLVPDLLAVGVVSIAIQRQPDTRLHCALTDGTVGILTYEPQEEVIAWSTWAGDTGTGAAVERAMVLPGLSEDAVFYHVRRTINGATKRYLEKWAKESECVGDTGLTWIMDCAASITDTGRVTLLNGVATHLVGESVVAWGSLDTGSTPHVDLSPDVAGVQTRYTVDTGGDVSLTLTEGVHHAVVGLPMAATWKSTKLAYAAQLGTALAQMKRAPQLALALYQTHPNGLFFGHDTGSLDALPGKIDGATVDQDVIHQTLDMVAVPMPSQWDPDARLVLRAKAPRPATVLAAIPTVVTSEK